MLSTLLHRLIRILLLYDGAHEAGDEINERFFNYKCSDLYWLCYSVASQFSRTARITNSCPKTEQNRAATPSPFPFFSSRTAEATATTTDGGRHREPEKFDETNKPHHSTIKQHTFILHQCVIDQPLSLWKEYVPPAHTPAKLLPHR